jgi:3-dehydroquinate dehydratase/shikimate dehydrogenase
MSRPPAYFVPLTHGSWEDALAFARRLPPEAMPELRLDLFPGEEPEELIRGLGRRCLVTCRRPEEGGAWSGDEASRLERLALAAGSRPQWLDLEWDVPLPPALAEARARIRLLRSVHVREGVFDLEARLADLPDGDAYKWVGHAVRLPDNARVKPALAWARDHEVFLSAFLMGPKGIASRCMQFAWGGSFTYACADDAGPAAPGQLPLARMLEWRCHKLHRDHALCGVLGDPVLHSRGPVFHNARFRAAFKDLLYLPLPCRDPREALEALEALPVLGASLTAPLKESLPALLGLEGPVNTLWRRDAASPWDSANTDAAALERALAALAPGPVLVLGGGGVAATSVAVARKLGRPVLRATRKAPLAPAEVSAFAPAGVIQATTLGMEPSDPAPFPELLRAAAATASWAVEWVYKEDTAFAGWAKEAGLDLVGGAALFEGQAEAQSGLFVRGCGGG